MDQNSQRLKGRLFACVHAARMRLYAKTTATRERVFFIRPQALEASSKNALLYDGWSSGAIIYAYVLGNPLSLIDADGLCPCGSSVDAMQLARGDKRDWSKAADRTDVNSGFGPGTYKCNLFADETLENAGYNLPNIGGGVAARAFGRYPPGAQSMSSSSYSVPGWPVVSGPAQAGDLVASGGHVGIATSANKTISASPTGVVENNWGFRPGQTSVIRRCTCP